MRRGFWSAVLAFASVCAAFALPGCLGLVNPVEREKPVVVVERDSVFVGGCEECPRVADTVYVKNTVVVHDTVYVQKPSVRDSVIFVGGPTCEENCMKRFPLGSSCQKRCLKLCAKSLDCGKGGRGDRDDDDGDDDLAADGGAARWR